MEKQVILSVCYSGVRKLITVDGGTKYDFIISEITDKWVELNSQKLALNCVVGELSNVCLDSQNDLDSLLLICDVSMVKIVMVVLSVANTVNSSNCAIENGLCNGQVDIVETGVYVYGGHEKNTIIDKQSHNSANLVGGSRLGKLDHMSAQIRGTSLLSDNWGECLKGGEGVYFPGNAAAFRIELIKYSSKLGFRFKYVRNSARYIHVVCYNNIEYGCDWYVKARSVDEDISFYVFKADLVHKCTCKLVSKCEGGMISSRIICELMIPNVQNNQRLCAKDVMDAMQIGYGVDVPYWKAHRAAAFAKDKVYGDHFDSYDEMFYYCKGLELTNPGSAVVFEIDPLSNRFERVFVSLKASMEGFKCCPAVLFIDGTFLKGRAQGTLLIATAKDGNRGLFPVAVALVSAEDTSNWAWFLSNLNKYVQHKDKISYLSDRNAGLMAAFPMVFREPIHFFCLFHLLKNLKGKYSSGLKKKERAQFIRLFEDCAYEPDKDAFAQKIIQFKNLGGKKADKWLSKLPYEKWAISYSPHLSRYGEMTSNAAESFNSWLLAARALPITKLFDFVRAGLSRWFIERRSASSLWSGILVPCREEDWNRLSLIGSKWHINNCPGGVYEVLSNPTTCVDLRSRICSCHEWEASGFPCCHAVAVIRKERRDVLSDIETYFLSSMYRECYKGDINPVPETLISDLQKMSKTPKIISPVLNCPAGRPKSKKRIPSHVELSKRKFKSAKCQQCGIVGTHDEWTCGISSSSGPLN